MNKKILIVGFACLSVVAVAQSNGTSEQSSKTSDVKAPRDIATGQASGRRINKKAGEPAGQPDATAREAATGKATGKTTAQDDWHQTAKTANSKPEVKNVSAADVNQDGSADHVAKGDVTGDGAADKAAAPAQGQDSNAAVNTSHSNIKNGREASSGMVTGKRQHKPITLRKPVDSDPKN